MYMYSKIHDIIGFSKKFKNFRISFNQKVCLTIIKDMSHLIEYVHISYIVYTLITHIYNIYNMRV